MRRAADGLPAAQPFVEWLVEGRDAYDPSCRVYLPQTGPEFPQANLAVHRHPGWSGRIVRLHLRFGAATHGRVTIKGFCTQFDARHPISSLSFLRGFLGFVPTPDGFRIDPRLPAAWPELTVDRIGLRDLVLAIRCGAGFIELTGAGYADRPVRIDPPRGGGRTTTRPSREAMITWTSARGSVTCSGVCPDTFLSKLVYDEAGGGGG